jgi:ubiquinone/menaquinone biosynthesis C-methylase UbiE
MARSPREAWQRLYAKHGLLYGGSGDIHPLEPYIRRDMLALDVGCGDGKTTELVARRCEVVGSDFSREALLSLRSQRPELSDVNLVECGLTSLPFCSEKFDIISCVHAISHLLKLERGLAAAELTRVLKHRGVILVEGFGEGDMRFREGSALEEGTYLRGNGIATHFFREGEIQKVFRELELVSEAKAGRRMSLGARSGRRETVRAVLRKT